MDCKQHLYAIQMASHLTEMAKWRNLHGAKPTRNKKSPPIGPQCNPKRKPPITRHNAPVLLDYAELLALRYIENTARKNGKYICYK